MHGDQFGVTAMSKYLRFNGVVTAVDVGNIDINHPHNRAAPMFDLAHVMRNYAIRGILVSRRMRLEQLRSVFGPL
jgi:hypothetical protein